MYEDDDLIVLWVDSISLSKQGGLSQKTETDRDRGDLLSYTIEALSLIYTILIDYRRFNDHCPLLHWYLSIVSLQISSNTSTILSGGGNECQLNLLPHTISSSSGGGNECQLNLLPHTIRSAPHTISSSRVRQWVLRMTRGFPFLGIRYNFNNAVIFYECEIYINKRGR